MREVGTKGAINARVGTKGAPTQVGLRERGLRVGGTARGGVFLQRPRLRCGAATFPRLDQTLLYYLGACTNKCI